MVFIIGCRKRSKLTRGMLVKNNWV
jgi:hypothetical protein